MSPVKLLLVLLGAAVAAADKDATPASPLQAEVRVDPERDLRDLQDMDGDASETKMMAAAGGAGAAAMHGHGKFFQYGHHDGKDHYENGFRRGNEHHFHERHEKAAPKHGHFTTKVRWGDKHGGYGEHYWDYNHGGHGDDGGDGGGEGSAPVPDIAEQHDEAHAARPQFKRQSFLDQSGAASGVAASGAESPGGRRAYRKKYVRPSTTTVAPTHPVPRARTTSRPPPHRQPPPSPTVAMAAASAKSSKTGFFPADFPGSVFQGGVPSSAAVTSPALGPRNARQTPGQAQDAGGLVRRLAFDPRTGRVHDEDTGQVFVLQPVS